MDSALPDNLLALMVRAGVDTRALALRARISQMDVERFLAGTAWPCPRVQQRLAMALGATAADLHREPDDLP